MSRAAEAAVVVLDMSLGLRHQDLQDALLYLEQQLLGKLLYNPKDELAVVTFGTRESRNELHRELGGYEGICVAVPWQQVSEGTLRELHGIPSAVGGRTEASDFVSAVVVAMDALVRAKGVIKKGSKRILLITCGAPPAEDPESPEDSTQEQVDQLSGQLAAQGVHLDIFLLPSSSQDEHQDGATNMPLPALPLLKRFLSPEGSGAQGASTTGSHEDPPSPSPAWGEKDKGGGVFLSPGPQAQAGDVGVPLLETPLGSVVCLRRARDLLFRVQHRVMPTTAYRGDMEVTPDLRIKVWAYKKTVRQRLPALSTYSEEAAADDASATHQVRLEREFRLRDDPETLVPEEELVRAYKYGPQVIPLSEYDRAAMRIHADKGVRLLGFTPRDRIPRHYFLRDVALFLPPPGDTLAAQALSALARAMAQAQRVAVARCKLTQREDAGVVLAALTPALSDDPKGLPDGLWVNTLPFAEDIREYSFAPLETHPARLQPTSQQEAAAEQLVRAMDLGPGVSKGDGTPVPGTESLQPEGTPNPCLQGYHELLRTRVLSLGKDPPLEPAQVPRPEEQVPWLQSDKEGAKDVFLARGALEKFQASFPVKEVSKKEA